MDPYMAVLCLAQAGDPSAGGEASRTSGGGAGSHGRRPGAGHQGRGAPHRRTATGAWLDPGGPRREAAAAAEEPSADREGPPEPDHQESGSVRVGAGGEDGRAVRGSEVKGGAAREAAEGVTVRSLSERA